MIKVKNYLNQYLIIRRGSIMQSKKLENFKKELEKKKKGEAEMETAEKYLPGRETPEKEPEYMKPTPYWKLERPLKLTYENLEIDLYEEYGALQIKIMGIDSETGKEYPEQKISLRKHILFEQPRMLFFLADIFKNWRKEYDVHEIEQHKNHK